MKRNRFTSRRPAIASAVVLCLLVFGPEPGRAEPPDNIEYTFARRNDTLVAWLNLARYFGKEQISALTDGVAFACEYGITLKRPRRLWGAEQIARIRGRVRVAYRPVTRIFALSVSDADSTDTARDFATVDRALEFLEDSIWVPLAAIDSLDAGAHYVGDLSVAVISLTTFNLATEDQPDDGSNSPLKFLFRQFLKATGYGREDYSTSSRKFSLSEVYPID